ncbi:23S rRNA (guanosine(2251)-2'-O)-methyltransferase RlmB [Candidatus Nomurabacteria bacterium RIFCSPLOWO2_01_FULL_42_20]|uniref:23S rRNA (Guanosine(2251)-2'-O)-methyltransferase RlmB n=1 Tax=Candidatus Nomurabacteria bacterium RIFCSPHIGHO2_01_FULL_42_16 TaxID=1801743 RepID=A0A1F6VK17_9BACT|nr:MAG: 23S rRNA (guanosine(2251)-2'-O)-methyltransferase RlmB [Candidatus Nomurabacteria bacterium RIFCSPHIGHO2_01_FULL_42_16]OGI92124.1 MAG: 23S rRNA (guanosine(2251)-2'-O)-methyltransferase RlmB [Candidatus Nomurabacteria bacterium RIFCSPLOWO2_01_FULL_42_20]
MRNNENSYIYGKHPVEEMLKSEPKRVQKIFIKKTTTTDFGLIKELSSANKVPVSFVDQKRISDIAGQEAVSQGVAALVSEAGFMNFEEFLSGINVKKNPAVIVLDEVEDPHNVGAIIRTAAAAGASAVIIGKHRQAPITAAVFKVSAGAAARLPIIRVSNINNALDKLKEAGFWIVALDQNAAGPEGSRKDGKIFWQEDLVMPVCFVVGNEGQGIRQKTLERADFKLRIPMHGAVESLNVSVSAALAIYEWVRQNGKLK